MSLDSVELAIFSGRLNAICEEMGFSLQRSALSPNIKDRLDFSCATFDAQGYIVAQAAHIPVHLGSMAYAMRHIVSGIGWQPGDMLVMNDPFMGGTHLPDVTLVMPIYFNEVLLGFAANRAHHANIGSESPGSMPLSRDAASEGFVIKPVKLMVRGKYDERVVRQLMAIEGHHNEEASDAVLPGDFYAQVSANLLGGKRLLAWIEDRACGVDTYFAGLRALNDYGSALTRSMLANLPEGSACFEDYMDGNGFSAEHIKIAVKLQVCDGIVSLDFTGTDSEVEGNINCPFSVCVASVYYVFVCLLPSYTPCCQGVFDCIKVSAPEGSLVNAAPGAAVAAGNVETSMRIVDVVCGALAAMGVDMPAASQGTMNNVAMGSHVEGARWDYYETIAGGSGAHAGADGLSAVQSHMTNTLNTPIESLERHYPLRIESYQILKGTGGDGRHVGGNGVGRAYRFLAPASVTLLTERRHYSPWGLAGGMAGAKGKNILNGTELPGKYSETVQAGDVLTIHTPGGGGWGNVGG